MQHVPKIIYKWTKKNRPLKKKRIHLKAIIQDIRGEEELKTWQEQLLKKSPKL